MRPSPTAAAAGLVQLPVVGALEGKLGRHELLLERGGGVAHHLPAGVPPE